MMNCSRMLSSQMNSSVRRLTIQPISRGVARTMTGPSVGNDGITGGYTSTLCKRSKSLYVLWQEYEFGIGGRKAAKIFSAEERGKVKFNYSLRKHYWELMVRLIRSGHIFNTAIDKIYSVYDRSRSVTLILRELRKDSRTGGYPQLSA